MAWRLATLCSSSNGASLRPAYVNMFFAVGFASRVFFGILFCAYLYKGVHSEVGASSRGEDGVVWMATLYSMGSGVPNGLHVHTCLYIFPEATVGPQFIPCKWCAAFLFVIFCT